MTRLRPLILASMTLVAGLAGCLGGEPNPAATASTADEKLAAGIADATATGADSLASLAQMLANDPANATVPAPVWNVRDAWTVTTGSPGGESASNTFVVTASSGTTYTLASTGVEPAVYDALFDISFIGPMRASDLAGSQAGAAVKFFDFPLTNGKTWSTTWDGLEVRVTATANPRIETPRGPQPGFDIVAALPDGTPHATYNYVPAVKWWTSVTFSEGWGHTVTEFKENWTGTAYAPVSKEVFSLAPVGPATHTPGQQFKVDEGQAVLAIVLIGHTEHQARAITLVDPNHALVPLPGGDDVMVDPAVRSEFRVDMIEAPAPGQWGILMAMAHEPDGFMMVSGHQIALDEIVVA